MVLDATAIRNLELVRNMKDGTKKAPSLISLITPRPPWEPASCGSGLNPLYDAARITSRQQAVGTLVVIPGCGQSSVKPLKNHRP